MLQCVLRGYQTVICCLNVVPTQGCFELVLAWPDTLVLTICSVCACTCVSSSSSRRSLQRCWVARAR
jgi:hypothetical protein